LLVDEITLKSSLFLAVSLALAAALGRRSAAARHLVPALGLAGAVAVPVLGLLAPPLELAWLPAGAPRPTSALHSPVTPPGQTSTTVDRLALPDLDATGEPRLLQGSRENDVAAAPAWAGPALALLATGSLLSLLYLSVGVVLVFRLERRASDLGADPSWPSLFEPLRRRLGLRRSVALRISDEAGVPLTVGLWRPSVIVPAESHRWSPAERRAVLLHELAHVARWDWAVQIVARLACALHWFNPLAWIACRRLLTEAERACDDVVLAGGESGPGYARQLLDLATRRRRELPVFGAVSMARRATLSRRVEAILDPGQRRADLARRHAVALTIVAATLVLIVGPARLVRGSARSQPSVGLELDATSSAQVEWSRDGEVEVEADVSVEDARWARDPALDASLERARGAAREEPPALLQAVHRGDLSGVRALLGEGADPDAGAVDLGTPLIVAAAYADLETVRLLLQAGASPDLSQIRRDRASMLPRSPLGAAARGGHPEIVRLLLDAGADPDFAPRGDATPLMIAARHGHSGAVALLLGAEADVDTALKGDGTALIAAAHGGQVGIVQRLLAAGADPNITVHGDGSPLIAAVRQGDGAMAAALLQAGAEADRWVEGDESPMYHAVASGQVEIARMLLDSGADPNAVWSGDGSPLIVAARTGDAAMTQLLVDAGARADVGVRGDGNALIMAAAGGRTDLLRALLAQGADPDASVRGDGSPLIAAARSGHLASVRLLVEAGADVDRIVPGDENPLIQAAGAGHLEVSRFLLDVGADPNTRVTVRGRDGEREVRSPLLQAQRAGHQEIVDLLRSRGATP
jgi:ankyrin repeat protein/beta-lactamase regulating signal transducer with metallopeptidase domain